MILSALRRCAVLVAIGACSTNKVPPPSSGESGVITTADAQAAPAPNRNRDLITREELANPSVSGLSVLDAIKSLRPQFLTVRGIHAVPVKDSTGRQLVDREAGKVHASLDGNKIVALDELSFVNVSSVSEIRFLNPSAAMQKFGGSAREGPVILVRTM